MLIAARTALSRLGEEQSARLQLRLSTFDFRSRWFGVGRSLICFAELTVVLITPSKALLTPVLTISDGARCGGVRAASAYCLVGGTSHAEYARWILVAALLVAAVGYRPRWTAIPQLWAIYSIAVSITVPDGGESVGMIMSLLMLPILLTDNRTWQWDPPAKPLRPSAHAIAYAAFWAVRLQLAYIYLDTAISKFGVADWANGTAEYYFLRDNMFGVAGPWDGPLLALSKYPLIVVAMTWGALVVELLIAVCILGSDRWRRVGLVLDILLHGSIILLMGLWSFALVMIGCSVVASMPLLRTPPAETPDEQLPTGQLPVEKGTNDSSVDHSVGRSSAVLR
ncbi:sporulation-delaying protein SdpB family protein [Streptomyces sp. NBC_01615]|uniref:sporulation-delaying protein SdpB family protein n=1 Tax=Streptomyces sp. NBC_01615 TaxID=2975898 RepID=UPI00386B75F1